MNTEERLEKLEKKYNLLILQYLILNNSIYRIVTIAIVGLLLGLITGSLL